LDYFVTQYSIDSPPGAVRAVLEDTIMQKNYPATAGSKILENFISPLDATVITKLEMAGVSILGKTKTDEFGAAGLFNAAGLFYTVECGTNNSIPVSGAVAAVADGVAEIALCNDYTGMISEQANRNGLYYIHPTYGTVSRYGLIPAVSSMDQIGVVCRTPADGFRILEIIAGYDPKDGAMFSKAAPQYAMRKAKPGDEGTATPCADGNPKPENMQSAMRENVLVAKRGGGGTGESEDEESAKCEGGGTAGTGGTKYRTPDSGLRIGIPVNVFSQGQDTSVIAELRRNYKTVDFELKYFDVFAQVMQILCCAELSNNITRYDGIKFGYRAAGFRNLHELYTKTRTEAFGYYTKLAAITGAMVLAKENYSRYYDKAMRIRRLITESLDFTAYDAIVMPCAGVPPTGTALNAPPTSLAPDSPPTGFALDAPPTSLAPDSPPTGFAPDAPPTSLALYALSRLCGLPSATVPFSGGGVTFIADRLREDVLIQCIH